MVVPPTNSVLNILVAPLIPTVSPKLASLSTRNPVPALLNVNLPEISASLFTSNAPATVSEPPRVVAPVPTFIVLPSAIATSSFNVVAPATVSEPPSSVAPVPTVMVLPSATATSSFNVVAPATVSEPPRAVALSTVNLSLT